MQDLMKKLAGVHKILSFFLMFFRHKKQREFKMGHNFIQSQRKDKSEHELT